MTKKELYTSPEVDVFVIQTEGIICQSNSLLYGTPGEPGAGFGDGGSFNL